jgi:ATP-binding cassette subfamily B protein
MSRRLLGRVFGYFLPYWPRGLGVLACIAMSAALGLVPALVIKGLIDYLAHPRGGLEPLALIVGVAVGAAILGGLVGIAQSYLSTSISEGIMYDLREQLFGRLLKQSVGFFINSRSGDLLSRMDNDIAGVEDVISDTVFGLVTSVIVLASTLVLMFGLEWRLTLAALLILPLFLYPSRRIGQLTYRARKRTQEKLAEMSVYCSSKLARACRSHRCPSMQHIWWRAAWISLPAPGSSPVGCWLVIPMGRARSGFPVSRGLFASPTSTGRAGNCGCEG